MRISLASALAALFAASLASAWWTQTEAQKEKLASDNVAGLEEETWGHPVPQQVGVLFGSQGSCLDLHVNSHSPVTIMAGCAWHPSVFM